MPLAGEIVRASDVATGAQSLDVAASETTTSGTYTDLATSGPAVTVQLAAGQAALVVVSAYMKVSATTAAARMAFAVSGAEVDAASDADSGYTQNVDSHTVSRQSLYVAGSGGAHTFTAKYRTGSGLTGTFADRRITVVPINPA